MADSARIVRNGIKGAGSPAGGTVAGGAAQVVALAALETRTGRIEVGTNGPSPMAILAENPNRKAAIVYNPTTDPGGSGAAGALLWIGTDENQTDHWFPIEPGSTYVHESRDWLRAWTGAGAPTVVYIIEERY